MPTRSPILLPRTLLASMGCAFVLCAVPSVGRADEGSAVRKAPEETRPNLGLGVFLYAPTDKLGPQTLSCCSPPASGAHNFRQDLFLSIGLENGPVRVAGQVGLGPNSWRGGGTAVWMFTDEGLGFVAGLAFSAANGIRSDDPYHLLWPAAALGLAYRHAGHTRFLLQASGGPALQSDVGLVFGLSLEAVAF